jgi:bifunctional DNA-binding transcriptional regulator/antitoxin component of YhaV-PrlF toxin-antitoxin module
MKELTFHAKLDARGKIQIPKRELEASGWQAGEIIKIKASLSKEIV